ncbi:TonB-dependent receptor [Parabacteroides sp. AM08-6]|nr:TonB-dependent receptor [Parabacteroides sp. AM08-6]
MKNSLHGRCIHTFIFLHKITIMAFLIGMLCYTPKIFSATYEKNIATQNRNVEGIVTNEEGLPIKGVLVTVKNKSISTTTDENGSFFIAAPVKSTIVFFHKDYIQAEMLLENQITLDIQLKHIDSRDKISDEVFLLYGSQNKDLMTGSYAQINGKDIETRAVVNNKNRISGLLPGLLIMQTNGEPGDEGANIFMRGKRTMRGKNPIILVDGYERSMDLLDPNEIKAVTVLKDAATCARYGLRGSNGIIQVTTNRGSEGKIRVNGHIRGGLKMPTTEPRLLDSYDYATLYNEARRNDGNSPLYLENHLNKYMNARNGIYENEYDKYLFPNNNYYEMFTKNVTWQQRYSVSVDGGNKFAKFFVSAGYTNNSGMYNIDKNANTYNTNAEQNAITIRSNVDINVTKRFVMSLDLSGRQEERIWPGARGSSVSDLFRNMYCTPPNAYPIFQPDIDKTTNKQMLGGSKDYTKNVYGLLNRSGYSKSLVRNMTATLKLNHQLDFITKGLNVRAEFAFDSWYEMNTNRSKNFKVYSIDADKNGEAKLQQDGSLKYIETGSDTQMSSGGDYPGSERILNYRVGLDWNRTFGNHNLYAEALFNQREKSQENDRNLPRVYRGYDTRVSYQYKAKYLADFNMGIMGSEQFLKSNRYGFFPALSLGWVASNEDFLKENPIISFLKLRASGGETGWDDTGGYFLWYQQFASSSGPAFGPTATGQSGWNEGAFALNNVTWEKARKYDVGLDVRLFNDRLSFTGDYFYEKNRDIMCAPALPYIMGIRFPDFPIGKVKNKGFDLSLSWNDHIGDFNYGLSFIYTRADNEIQEMGEEKKAYSYQQRTGKPLDSQWGLIALGLFQSQEEIDNSPKQTYSKIVSPGDIKYKDVNGDGVIDNYDEVYLGPNADLNMQWGSKLDLSWKNFDFSVLFTGQNGGWNNITGESIWEFQNNGTVREHHLGRFNPDDPSSWANATYPRLSLSNVEGNHHSSSYWRKSMAQVRLKHIELGYSIPVAWSKGIVNNLRLYVNAYNILTWQSTDLTDTEAKNGSYIQYPIMKMVNFGVNVSF